MHWCRMVIAEAISDNQVREFTRIFEDTFPQLQNEPGHVRTQLVTEDGGNMVVIITTWKSREDCLAYHCGRAYRQFIARTQHLLVGQMIVKLFRDETPVCSPVS